MWSDIQYLNYGTMKQIEAFHVLTKLNVFDDLQTYKPLLIGTIPIDIDISGSDLDIICEVLEPDEFIGRLTTLYSMKDCFTLRKTRIREIPSVVCNFNFNGLPIEIFGQPISVFQQNGYLHMEIEKRLLKIAGEQAKDGIRKLKKQGMKTEPAFCEYFQLEGEPYTKLISLGELSDFELKRMIKI
ncbi:hypothetical protein QFZ81_003743 [Paenibacillus sp. V4I9]|uniref:DUF4269 domain-containing protein n=1 Tax=Paenibacillus sp. V4I9 TaxID=3042308 RepID=UPI00277FA87A|nr:DUF4269 domain-containing protein [Paenibacillus sp. V4I9]MDQ0888655.1 hypothetical protein [Paenibacillus sp. V4I9]